MTKFSKTVPAEPMAAAAQMVAIDAAVAEALPRAVAALASAAGDVLAATTRRDPVFQQLGAAIDTATAARSAFEAALVAQSTAQGDAVRSEDATVSVETPR